MEGVGWDKLEKDGVFVEAEICGGALKCVPVGADVCHEGVVCGRSTCGVAWNGADAGVRFWGVVRPDAPPGEAIWCTGGCVILGYPTCAMLG